MGRAHALELNPTACEAGSTSCIVRGLPATLTTGLLAVQLQVLFGCVPTGAILRAYFAAVDPTCAVQQAAQAIWITIIHCISLCAVDQFGQTVQMDLIDWDSWDETLAGSRHSVANDNERRFRTLKPQLRIV